MKKILYLLLLLLPLTLSAEKVSEPRARELATKFLKQQIHSRAGSLDLQLVYDGSDLHSRAATHSDSPFYIYNNQAGEGFVIVSGDDLAKPILGFATDAHFKVKDMPANLQQWLKDLDKQITWARKHKLVRSQQIIQAWKTAEQPNITPILQLTTAQWGQHFPYNQECPIINGQKVPTGCVATATAILMKYHRWPERGIGTLPSYKYLYGDDEIIIPERKLGEPYLWDKMPLVYNKNESEESQQQIARLMADIGTMIRSLYAPGGTAATTEYVIKKMPTYMGYDKDVQIRKISSYNISQWKERLRNELHTNGPILYDGFNNDGAGHDFILDGYAQNDYFHFNWGWEGYANGYFVLEATDPSDKDLISFPIMQNACFGLVKEDGIDNSIGECFINQFDCMTDKIEKDKPFHFNVILIRKGYNLKHFGEVVVWLIDKYGNKKEQLTEVTPVYFEKDVWGGDFYVSYQPKLFGIRHKPLETGDYMRLYYRINQNDEWNIPYHSKLHSSDLLFADTDGSLLRVKGPITIDYYRKRQALKVTYPQGTKLNVTRGSTIDFNDMCEFTETSCIIPTDISTNGQLSLRFNQGKAQKVMYLQFTKMGQ